MLIQIKRELIGWLVGCIGFYGTKSLLGHAAPKKDIKSNKAKKYYIGGKQRKANDKQMKYGWGVPSRQNVN